MQWNGKCMWTCIVHCTEWMHCGFLLFTLNHFTPSQSKSYDQSINDLPPSCDIFDGPYGYSFSLLLGHGHSGDLNISCEHDLLINEYTLLNKMNTKNVGTHNRGRENEMSPILLLKQGKRGRSCYIQVSIHITMTTASTNRYPGCFLTLWQLLEYR